MSEAKIHLVLYRYVNSQTLMISHKKWQMLHRDASLCPKWCLHNKDCDIECNHHENCPICEQNCGSVHLLYLSMESESHTVSLQDFCSFLAFLSKIDFKPGFFLWNHNVQILDFRHLTIFSEIMNPSLKETKTQLTKFSS